MISEHKTLIYKGKVIFHKITFDTPQREIKPFEDNEACFMFVNEGEFSVRTPDEFVLIKKSRGLLAKCFNFFIESSKDQRSKNSRISAIGVFLHPFIVEEILDIDLSKSKNTVDYNVKPVQIDALLDSFKDSISVYLDNPELADENIIKTKLKEFILLISKTQNVASQVDFLSAMFKINETEFKKTISNNLYSNLTINEFAKLASLSVSSFKRKFKQEFQESPKKYLERMKLLKATELLKDESLRISEIAYDCGYETLSTFNRSFKSKYKLSPSEYRLNQTA